MKLFVFLANQSLPAYSRKTCVCSLQADNILSKHNYFEFYKNPPKNQQQKIIKIKNQPVVFSSINQLCSASELISRRYELIDRHFICKNKLTSSVIFFFLQLLNILIFLNVSKNAFCLFKEWQYNLRMHSFIINLGNLSMKKKNMTKFTNSI